MQPLLKRTSLQTIKVTSGMLMKDKGGWRGRRNEAQTAGRASSEWCNDAWTNQWLRQTHIKAAGQQRSSWWLTTRDGGLFVKLASVSISKTGIWKRSFQHGQFLLFCRQISSERPQSKQFNKLPDTFDIQNTITASLWLRGESRQFSASSYRSNWSFLQIKQ